MNLNTGKQLTLGALISEEPPCSETNKVELPSALRDATSSTQSDSTTEGERVLAPMLQQYRDLKRQYSDHLILFQVGDFYEVFFEDAHTVSDVLGIRLTSRDKNQINPIPMCGVPIHAIESYVPKLVTSGYSCVLFSQIDDGANRKSIRREISRIVTPGVRFEGDGLDDRKFNYLAAVIFHFDAGAMAYIDVSTGHLRLAEFQTVEELIEGFERVAPTELILPQSIAGKSTEKTQLWWREIKRRATELGVHLVTRPFDHVLAQVIDRRVRERMSDSRHFAGIQSLARESLSAIDAVMNYVEEVSFGKLPPISDFALESGTESAVLDAATRRNLELLETRIDGERRNSLIAHIDRSRTAMGSRLLRLWVLEPSQKLDQIIARHDAVAELCARTEQLQLLRAAFLGVRDLDRLLSRVTTLRAHPRDLAGLRDSLAILPEIKGSLSNFAGSLLESIATEFDTLEDLSVELSRALVGEPPTKVNEGGIFREGYDADLDELRALSTDATRLLSALETEERELTGISNLKVRYNSVFGYFIEVSKAQINKVPAHYDRRQTLANGERYVTPRLKELEQKILSARGRQVELEKELYLKLRADVADAAGRIQRSSVHTATLDVLAAFADLALHQNYVRPEISETAKIEITNGRHPVVERVVGEHNFVANNTALDGDQRRFAILTGPNMGGKSTYLRQVGLIQILAQAGSFVPAERAVLGIVDRIFTRIGAADNLSRGDSTFMVEMREATSIVKRATARSLVLIDEIGRGTATTDGLAIATAIAEWLHEQIKCPTIFATHFHELTLLPESRPGMFCLSVGVLEREGEVEFTHRIEERPADRSYGIEVARLAGLPEQLLVRASEILSSLSGEEGKCVSSVSVKRRDTNPTRTEVARPQTISPLLATMIKELDTIDPNRLTPLEALLYLTRLRERLLDHLKH